MGNNTDNLWQSASAAVEKYGSYLDAVLATTREIAALEAQIESYQNSRSSSYSSSSSGIGTSAPPGSTTSQTTNVVGNSGNYDTSGDSVIQQANSKVAQMKQNSANWATGDRDKLHNENVRLAKELEGLLGYSITYDAGAGTWYMNGRKLYDQFPIYHKGGIVGDEPTLKQNEVFAKLKKGETVFTDEQQKSIYKALDFAETTINQFGGLFAKINATDMMNMRMQDDFNKKAQQIQNIVQTSGGDTYNIDVPVEIRAVQKLDAAEIRQLTKDISKHTMTEINDSLAKKGFNSVREPLIKA